MILKRLIVLLLLAPILFINTACDKPKSSSTPPPPTTITPEPRATSLKFKNFYRDSYILDNNPIAFTVTVSSVEPDSDKPISGTVVFSANNGAEVCEPQELLDDTFTATCGIKFKTFGKYEIVASYSGNSYYKASSNLTIYEIHRSDTTLTLQTDQSSYKPYENAIVTARVHYFPFYDKQLNGTVNFFLDNMDIEKSIDCLSLNQNQGTDTDGRNYTDFICETNFLEADNSSHNIIGVYDNDYHDKIYNTSEGSSTINLNKIDMSFNFDVYSDGLDPDSKKIIVDNRLCVKATPSATLTEYINEISHQEPSGQFSFHILGEEFKNLAFNDLKVCTKKTKILKQETIQNAYKLVYKDVDDRIYEYTNKKFHSIDQNQISLVESKINILSKDYSLQYYPGQKGVTFSALFYRNNGASVETPTGHFEFKIKKASSSSENFSDLCQGNTFEPIDASSGQWKISCVSSKEIPDEYANVVIRAYYSGDTIYSSTISNDYPIALSKIGTKVNIINHGAELENSFTAVVKVADSTLTALATPSTGTLSFYQGSTEIKFKDSCSKTPSNNNTTLTFNCKTLYGGLYDQIFAHFNHDGTDNRYINTDKSSQISFNLPIELDYSTCDSENACSFDFYAGSNIDGKEFKITSIETIDNPGLLQAKTGLLLHNNDPDKEWLSKKNILFECNRDDQKFSCKNFAPFSDHFNMFGYFIQNPQKLLNLYVKVDSSKMKPASEKIQPSGVKICGRFGISDDGIQDRYTTEQRMYDCSKQVIHFAGYGNGNPYGAIDKFELGNQDSIDKSWFLVSCYDTNPNHCSWLTPLITHSNATGDNFFTTSFAQKRKDHELAEDRIMVPMKNFIGSRFIWSGNLTGRYDFFGANGFKSWFEDLDCNNNTYAQLPAYDGYLYLNDTTIPNIGTMYFHRPVPIQTCEPILEKIPAIDDIYYDNNFTEYTHPICKTTSTIGKALIDSELYQWEVPSYPQVLMLSGGTLRADQPAYCEQDGDGFQKNDLAECLTTVSNISDGYKGFRANSLIPFFSTPFLSSSASSSTTAWIYFPFGGYAWYGHHYSNLESDPTNDYQLPVRCVSTTW